MKEIKVNEFANLINNGELNSDQFTIEVLNNDLIHLYIKHLSMYMDINYEFMNKILCTVVSHLPTFEHVEDCISVFFERNKNIEIWYTEDKNDKLNILYQKTLFSISNLQVKKFIIYYFENYWRE